MYQTPYSNATQARQAKRVTTAAQYGLASATSNVVTLTQRNLNIAPETIAGTVALWSYASVTSNQLLRQQALSLIEHPCRTHGILVEPLGEYPLFTGIKLVRGSLSDVVIVPAEEDPLLHSRRFPLPRHVRNRLKAMRKAGVPFDRIFTYIAHEVPRNSVEATLPLPLEAVRPPDPASSLRTVEQLGNVAHALHSTLFNGIGAVTRTSVQGAGVAAAGIGALTTFLLDPLIFGAIADERGMASWFVLAQWAW
jgi:hypothetical protein